MHRPFLNKFSKYEAHLILQILDGQEEIPFESWNLSYFKVGILLHTGIHCTVKGQQKEHKRAKKPC